MCLMSQSITVNGNTYEIKPYANLYNANLSYADLHDANLSYANLHTADLRGADLYNADLSNADLRGAHLYNADLYNAHLSYADLRGANLSYANLYNADLSNADLYGANLHGAHLSYANLYNADLYGANLHGANLHGAHLRDAKNAELVFAQISILPTDGDVVGWKKAYSLDRNGYRGDPVLVKLRVPADAKRSNSTGRKCRAEFAEVLEIAGADEAMSSRDPDFRYRVGEIVRPTTEFDEDRFNECSTGIHFFITREEAEAY